MADANKPSFAFGKPASSGTSSTPLFGATASNDAGKDQGKSLFGGGASGSTLFGGANNNPTTTSGGGGIFGGASSKPGGFSFTSLGGSGTQTPSMSAPPASGASLFGGGGNTATSGAPPSLFNFKTAESSGGGQTFGNQMPASTSSNKNSLFGGAQSSTTGNLFQNVGSKPDGSASDGSNTPQPKAPSQLSFTPAGNPPNTGNSGAGGSLGGQSSLSTPFTAASVFDAKKDESKFPKIGSGTPGGKSLFGEMKPPAGKPVDNASGKPSTPSLFSAPPATTRPGTGLFGAPLASAPAAPSSAQPSPFGNFGKKPVNDTAPNSAPPPGTIDSIPPPNKIPASNYPATTGLQSSPSLFSPSGALGASQTGTSQAASSAAQPATAAPATAAGPTSGQPSGASLFGSATATPQQNPGSAPATSLFGSKTATNQQTSGPAPAASIFGSTATPAQQPTTNAADPAQAAPSGAAAGSSSNGLFGASVGERPSAASASTAQQPSSRLASKSLDEIITMWSTSLATHQKTFSTLAERVSKWDRQLVENSTAIGKLYSRVFQAERDTAEVERQLSNVESGQRDLDARLNKYEAELDSMLDAAGLGEQVTTGGVDGEREQTYRAAEDCQSRLTDMGHSLSAMIDEINVASNKLSSTAKKSNATEDPLAQIVRVLNGHLSQLQTIDKGAQALGAKVEQAQKEAGVLAGRQGINGGREWVEGFGRSYLGRR